MLALCRLYVGIRRVFCDLYLRSAEALLLLFINPNSILNKNFNNIP